MVFSEHASNTLRTAVSTAFPAFAAALVAMLALAAPAHAAVTTTTSGNTTTTSVSYSGGVQTFTAPYTGTYTLEVWGAQGANASNSGGSRNGGKGGYATGTVTLNAGSTIYIAVGGQGSNITEEGGYNGGGLSHVTDYPTPNPRTHAYYSDCGSGGGATSITSTNRGVLKNFEDYKNEVYIVAGGGGSAKVYNPSNSNTKYSGDGGDGGGLTGGNGKLYASTEVYGYGAGGTQTAGGGIVSVNCSNGEAHGSFGQGADVYTIWSQETNPYYLIGAGGGGGWYGGGSLEHSPAGGGSSYIGGVTGGSTTAGQQSGNGKAEITYTRAISITYDANGGQSAPASQTLAYNSAITTSQPTRTGYTFKGWSETQNGNPTIQPGDKITTSSSTPTLYAQWEINPRFYVTYDGNGATSGSMPASDHRKGHSSNLSANAFSKTGYTFDGWSVTEMPGEVLVSVEDRSYPYPGSGEYNYFKNLFLIDNGGSSTILADLLGARETGKPLNSLYTVESSGTYFVSYGMNAASGSGGSDVMTVTDRFQLPSGQVLQTVVYLAAFSKTGDSELRNLSIAKLAIPPTSKLADQADASALADTGLVKLSATWKPIEYEIAYDGNGATSGTMANSEHVYDSSKSLSANKYSRTGFEFSGWNTQADGSGQAYSNSQSVSNLTSTDGDTVTLYAQWRFDAEVSGIEPINPDEDGNGYGDNLAFSAPCDISAVVKPNGDLVFPETYVQNLSAYRIEISGIESAAEDDWVLMSSLPQSTTTKNALCVSLGIGSADPVNLTAYSSKTALSGQLMNSNATKNLVWSGSAANISGSSDDFASVKWYVRPAYE